MQIEKFALHVLADPALTQRLSPKELAFAKQYAVLFESHVTELALNKFADEHRSLTTDGMGMCLFKCGVYTLAVVLTTMMFIRCSRCSRPRHVCVLREHCGARTAPVRRSRR